MTKDDFDLLLIDLSARLKYGLIIRCDAGDQILSGIIHSKTLGFYGCIESYEGYDFPLDECKPYLRDMKTMSDKDVEEFQKLMDEDLDDYAAYMKTGKRWKNDRTYKLINEKQINWLNKNMYDYRGLIEKGLALKASDDMYKL